MMCADNQPLSHHLPLGCHLNVTNSQLPPPGTAITKANFSQLLSTGWASESQHGEADLLRPVCTRKAGPNWCISCRETEQRCGQAPIWVRTWEIGQTKAIQSIGPALPLGKIMVALALLPHFPALTRFPILNILREGLTG